MANNPAVPVPAILQIPAASDLTLDMSVKLDAYMNTLDIARKLCERRNAKRDEFLKSFLPELASGNDARIDAAMQKYAEWKKTDSEQDRQIDGLEELSDRLWREFRKAATGFPEAATFLLKVKISVIDAQIAAVNEGLIRVARHREQMQDELDQIQRHGGLDDPERVLEEFRRRIRVQVAGLPFKGSIVDDIMAVADRDLQRQHQERHKAQDATQAT